MTSQSKLNRLLLKFDQTFSKKIWRQIFILLITLNTSIIHSCSSNYKEEDGKNLYDTDFQDLNQTENSNIEPGIFGIKHKGMSLVFTTVKNIDKSQIIDYADNLNDEEIKIHKFKTGNKLSYLWNKYLKGKKEFYTIILDTETNYVGIGGSGPTMLIIKEYMQNKYFEIQKKALEEPYLGAIQMEELIFKAREKYNGMSILGKALLLIRQPISFIFNKVLPQNILKQDSFLHKLLFGWFFYLPLKTILNLISISNSVYGALFILSLIFVISQILILRFNYNKSLKKSLIIIIGLWELFLLSCFAVTSIFMIPDATTILVLSYQGISPSIIEKISHWPSINPLVLVLTYCLGIFILCLFTPPCILSKQIDKTNNKHLIIGLLIVPFIYNSTLLVIITYLIWIRVVYQIVVTYEITRHPLIKYTKNYYYIHSHLKSERRKTIEIKKIYVGKVMYWMKSTILLPILLLFVFYLGMFIVNFFISVASFSFQLIDVLKSAMSMVPVYDFLITCIDAGIFYFLWATYVFGLVNSTNRFNNKEKIIGILLSMFYIIAVYDVHHMNFSLLGVADLFREWGADLWRTLDLLSISFEVSPMRYIVFDVAIVLSGILFIFGIWKENKEA